MEAMLWATLLNSLAIVLACVRRGARHRAGSILQHLLVAGLALWCWHRDWEDGLFAAFLGSLVFALAMSYYPPFLLRLTRDLKLGRARFFNRFTRGLIWGGLGREWYEHIEHNCRLLAGDHSRLEEAEQKAGYTPGTLSLTETFTRQVQAGEHEAACQTYAEICHNKLPAFMHLMGADAWLRLDDQAQALEALQRAQQGNWCNSMMVQSCAASHAARYGQPNLFQLWLKLPPGIPWSPEELAGATELAQSQPPQEVGPLFKAFRRLHLSTAISEARLGGLGITLLSLTALSYLFQPTPIWNSGYLSRDALERGEWWRWVTYMFTHGSWAHVLMNLLGMAFSLPVIEAFLGRRWLAVYLLAGLVGAQAQLSLQPKMILIGASAGVFGLYGAFAGVCFRLRELPPPRRRQALITVAAVLLIQTMLDQIIPKVAGVAHLAGFFTGLGLALVLPWTRRTGPGRLLRHG